ncbi:WXG100 family type VII secretion target [Mycolicibacterium litorale]|uniref:WXG100 family type VII secretion target n=1 Tax=Mycolicibacterium litorale TaxID=758802 RepID=UPI00399F46D5
MLPSRSRLEGWNPDSLTFTGQAVTAGGDTVLEAIDRINNNVKIMPETKAWAGPAHDAASKMFDRAHGSTTAFRDSTSAIGDALTDGANTIGAARTALLSKADEVDCGPLNVSEGWVVLIDPGAQTAEEIAQLMDLVAIEQAAINDLLVAVDEADRRAADNVMAAARALGFVPPTSGGLPGMMTPGAQRPADDVPNPRDPLGLMQQATVRGEEMATTVRETSSGYNDEGHLEKTLVMQDGSKHVITEIAANPHNRIVDRTITEDHYDANGNLISWTSSTTTPSGYKKTIMNWADGTQYVVDETPDGIRSGGFNLADGRHSALPPDSPILMTTVPERIGDVLTGLETHIGDGGKIPMLSMEAVGKVETGAKYGGPTLGVMSSMYDFLAAPTPADKCVSVFAGAFSLTGNALGGAGGAAAGSFVPIPGAVPVLAVGAGYAAGEWMKSIGTKVGTVLCGA